MTINPSSGSPGPRLDGTTGAGGTRRSGQAPRVGGPAAAPPAENVVHRDVVDISSAARALVARDGDESVSPERLVALRQQVLEGAYNQTETIEALARRIRLSGDLG